MEEIMKTVIQIEGMSCDHCVQHVKEALEAVTGVISAAVSLNAKTAEVEHGPEVNLVMLKTAVEKAGYEVN